MRYGNTDIELSDQVSSKMLGAINRTVLTSGTAEANLEMSELPLYEALHMSIHKRVDVVQESDNLSVILQELYDLFIHAGKLPVIFVFARVIH